MSHRLPLFLSLLLLLAVPLCRGAEMSATELAELAKQRRATAEEELASFRRKQIEERKALVDRLQAVYRDMNVASEDARAATTERAELARNRAEFLRNEESYRFKYQALREELASCGGKSFDQKATSEALAQEAWQELQKRLAQIDRAGSVQVTQEEVILRDGTKAKVPVLYLGKVAAYACGGERNMTGLCEATNTGTLRITGASLTSDAVQALLQGARGNVQALPLDVSGTLGSREDRKPRTWLSRVQAGGMFVYPILLCGLWGLLLVLERLRFFWRNSLPAAGLIALRQAIDGASSHETEAGTYARYPEGRLTVRGLQAYEQHQSDPDAALEAALMAEEPQLQRSLSMLAALSGVAPFLGLLGTVSGMIHTFSDIAAFGADNSRILSGGISEALITTELGLMVAVPLLLAHSWLNSSLERRSVQLEEWAMEIVRRLKERGSKA